ncbi:MAG: PTS sugar transporter subunit IIC [Clostridia bacterium]
MKNKIKKVLNHVFVEGLTGMAWGLFATLIIGLILTQIGGFIPGRIGELIVVIGKIASALTGAGIGIGVAIKFNSGTYVTVSAGIAGMVGAFATQILAGKVFTETGLIVFSGPGEPLGAFIASIIGIELGNLITGKTKVDIILVPLTTILSGALVGLLIGPIISSFMTGLGALINWSVERQPILMGILVSVIMGMILTLPISSAAISIILNLSGLAAGAATVGCSANMIGFAVASFKENKFGGLISQGIGTSMLQVPNIMKKPVIWLPAIIASAILGPLSTTVFQMTNNASGAGMGTSGLVGQIMTWETMIGTETPMVLLLKILLLHFILPAIIAGTVAFILRKKNIIKDGDMKLQSEK